MVLYQASSKRPERSLGKSWGKSLAKLSQHREPPIGCNGPLVEVSVIHILEVKASEIAAVVVEVQYCVKALVIGAADTGVPLHRSPYFSLEGRRTTATEGPSGNKSAGVAVYLILANYWIMIHSPNDLILLPQLQRAIREAFE